MSDMRELSEAKRALLEKYLRGSIPQPPNATNVTMQPTKAERNADGPRERVVPIQVGGDKPPFFFLYGDWRGRSFYCYPMAHDLGANQPFYLLEPYNCDGLPIVPSFENMAAAHLKSLRAVQPEGPYFLGGFCNGGLIAYEMARQLHMVGQTVDLLVLMDSVGPPPIQRRLVRSAIALFCNLLRLNPAKQLDLFLLTQHLYRYLRFTHYRRAKNTEYLKSVKRRAALSGIGSLIMKYEVLFPTKEVLREHWPGIYYWMAYGYVPSLYAGKITFFWDSEDTWRPLWWRKVLEAKKGDIEEYTIPGTHIVIKTESIHILAERLKECLSKAQEASSSFIDGV